jgi:hypothetical protein
MTVRPIDIFRACVELRLRQSQADEGATAIAEYALNDLVAQHPHGEVLKVVSLGLYDNSRPLAFMVAFVVIGVAGKLLLHS